MGSQHTEGPSTHSVGRLDLRNTTLGVVSPASGLTAVHAKQLWPRALWVQEGFPEQGSSKPCRYPLPFPCPHVTSTLIQKEKASGHLLESFLPRQR